MKEIIKKIIYSIIYSLSRSETIYYFFSKKLVDCHRNENNCNFETNGEGYFIEKHLQDFEVVFDVGANIGEWSNFVSNRLVDGKIYSFEPSKNTFNTLEKNIKNKNIYIFNIGLGEKTEEKTFYNYGDNSTLNSSINRNAELEFKSEEKAYFDSLDNFCDQNDIKKISFLKIDVEGGELSVLKGSEKFISEAKIDYIQFEYGGTYIDANILLKDVFDFFQNKPYTIYKIMQKKIIKIQEYKQDLENFQYSNYLAIINKNEK